MTFGSGDMAQMLWHNALAAVPLAFLVAVVCRVAPLRPSTRHLLWLAVLVRLLLPPLPADFNVPPPLEIQSSSTTPSFPAAHIEDSMGEWSEDAVLVEAASPGAAPPAVDADRIAGAPERSGDWTPIKSALNPGLEPGGGDRGSAVFASRDTALSIVESRAPVGPCEQVPLAPSPEPDGRHFSPDAAKNPQTPSVVAGAMDDCGPEADLNPSSIGEPYHPNPSARPLESREPPESLESQAPQKFSAATSPAPDMPGRDEAAIRPPPAAPSGERAAQARAASEAPAPLADAGPGNGPVDAPKQTKTRPSSLRRPVTSGPVTDPTGNGPEIGSPLEPSEGVAAGKESGGSAAAPLTRLPVGSSRGPSGLEAVRLRTQAELAAAWTGLKAAMGPWFAQRVEEFGRFGREIGPALTRVRDALLALPPLPGEVWWVGVGLIALTLVGRSVSLHFLLRASRPAPAETRRLIEMCRRRMRLHRSPNVRIHDKRISPLVFSGRRTTLLLPSELWEQLDRAGREAIVCHELAHVKRWDHLICWLEMVVTRLFWWHPLAWWAARRVRDEAEHSCDLWVTWLMPGERRAYAEAMVRTRAFISRLSWDESCRVAFTTGRAQRMSRRIKMVMTSNRGPRMTMFGLVLALLLGGAGWVATPAALCPPDAKKDKGEAAKPVALVLHRPSAAATVVVPTGTEVVPAAIEVAGPCTTAQAAESAPAAPCAVAAPCAAAEEAPSAVVRPLSTFESYLLGKKEGAVAEAPALVAAQPQTPGAPQMVLVADGPQSNGLEDRVRRLEEEVRRLNERLSSIYGRGPGSDHPGSHATAPSGVYYTHPPTAVAGPAGSVPPQPAWPRTGPGNTPPPGAPQGVAPSGSRPGGVCPHCGAQLGGQRTEAASAYGNALRALESRLQRGDDKIADQDRRGQIEAEVAKAQDLARMQTAEALAAAREQVENATRAARDEAVVAQRLAQEQIRKAQEEVRRVQDATREEMARVNESVRREVEKTQRAQQEELRRAAETLKESGGILEKTDLAPLAMLMGQAAQGGRGVDAPSADRDAVEVRIYELSEGKLKALGELMLRSDVPIPVRIIEDKSQIEVHATPAQHDAFLLFVSIIEPKDETAESYGLSKGKLEALANLMVRDDVPVMVSPGDDSITVHGNTVTQIIFRGFLNLIEPDRKQPAGGAAAPRRGVMGGGSADATGTTGGLGASRRSAKSMDEYATVESEAEKELEETATRDRLSETVAKLEADLADTTAAARDLQHQVKSMEKQASDLEKKADSLESKADKLENADREGLLRQAEELMNQSREIERQRDDVERHADKMQEKAEELQEKLSEYKSKQKLAAR